MFHCVINSVVVNLLSFYAYLSQTCFVDCLIEQTHPEIRKRDDMDVSPYFLKKRTFLQLVSHLSMATEITTTFVLFQLRYTDILFTEQEVCA